MPLMDASAEILGPAFVVPGALREVIGNPQRAAKLLEELRWPDGPKCPRCGGSKVEQYGKKGRSWFCLAKEPCKPQTFSVRTGTYLEGAKIPLDKEAMLLALYAETGNWLTLPALLMVEAGMGQHSAHKRVAAFKAAVLENGLELGRVGPAPDVEEPLYVEPEEPREAFEELEPEVIPAEPVRGSSWLVAALALGAVMAFGMWGLGRTVAAAGVERVQVAPTMVLENGATFRIVAPAGVSAKEWHDDHPGAAERLRAFASSPD